MCRREGITCRGVFFFFWSDFRQSSFFGKFQSFSRVMTRPVVSQSRGSSRVNRLQNLLGRVGSTGFTISRVGSGPKALKSRGSGRVKRLQNLAGRVRSGQEVFKISRVGSGHDPRDTGHFAGQAIMTRELFWAEPRVQPADLAGGSAFFKLTGESHVDAV